MTFRQNWKKLGKRLLYGLECLIGGSRIRETVLLRLLEHHYRSVYRREWKLGDEPPHFYQHRLGIFQLAFGTKSIGPEPWYRGTFASEVIRDGDCLLDIGCGDGFFAVRYFGSKCHHIDAIDIEPTAIQAAKACHAAPNICYHLGDAVHEPFPRDHYDVVIWDGAIGHFAAMVTQRMLAKISRVLDDDGVFVGSETLGDHEGHDHLQYFYSLEELHDLLKTHFPYIELKSTTYRIGFGTPRTEAYWRCAKQPGRLDACAWQRMSTGRQQQLRAA